VVWSTLALSIRADGTANFEVVGASSFPRHWIYGHDGTLQAKTGLIDFDTWYRESFGEKNPWGDEESPAVVTAVETELERELSAIIIGSDPPFRRLRAGEALVEQGQAGDELYLLFDGVLAVEQDGRQVAEVGPGAILGEMALLEGGRRTATLRAVTRCRVAVVPGDRVDRAALAEVARGRRGG
jgi:CRP-like cAMP-binding protein